MGTHYAGTSGQIEALNTYIKLIRSADTIISRVYSGSHMKGITVSQFGVLETIYHLGPMHQREIGTKILKSSGNITMVVDNLERRGLVERHRDRPDRRYVSVHLTPAGKELVERIFPEHVRLIEQELSVLTSAEKEQLGHLCKQLGLSNEKSVSNQAAD